MHPVEDAAVSVYSNSRKLPEPSIACINYARFFRRNHTMSTFLRPLYETYMALPVCKKIFALEEIGCCHLQAWSSCSASERLSAAFSMSSSAAPRHRTLALHRVHAPTSVRSPYQRAFIRTPKRCSGSPSSLAASSRSTLKRIPNSATPGWPPMSCQPTPKRCSASPSPLSLRRPSTSQWHLLKEISPFT